MGVFDYFRKIISQVAPRDPRSETLRNVAAQVQPTFPQGSWVVPVNPDTVAVEPPTNAPMEVSTPTYEETRLPGMGVSAPETPPPPPAPPKPIIGNIVPPAPPQQQPALTTGTFADTTGRNLFEPQPEVVPIDVVPPGIGDTRFQNLPRQAQINQQRMVGRALNPDGTIPTEGATQIVNAPVSSTFDVNKVQINVPANPKVKGSRPIQQTVVSEAEAKALGPEALKQYQEGVQHNKGLQITGVRTAVSSPQEAARLGGALSEAQYRTAQRADQGVNRERMGILRTVSPRPLEELDETKATVSVNGSPYFATRDAAGQPYFVDRFARRVNIASKVPTVGYNNKMVIVSDDGKVVDTAGNTVTDLATALQDRNFKYEYTLNEIRKREAEARASGDRLALARIQTEKERAALDWTMSRPKDTKRGFKDFLKGLAIGALRGYATNGIGGALGGAAVGGVGSIINPDFEEKLADVTWRIPRAQQRLAEAQALEKGTSESEKMRREGIRDEEKMRTEIAEGFAKRLEALPFWKQRFGAGGNGRLTQGEINAINKTLGFNTGLVPQAGRTTQITLPNGQLARIDDDGIITLASLATADGTKPVVFESKAERPVTINGAEFMLDAEAASRMVGDFAKQNLNIAIREAENEDRRETAMMRLGMMGTQRRLKALQRIATIQGQTNENKAAIEELTKEMKRLSDLESNILNPVDPTTGEVIANFQDNQIVGPDRTYLRSLRSQIARINMAIRQRVEENAGGTELMKLIDQEAPEIVDIKLPPAPRLPRANISVGPRGGASNQPTVSSSAVDALIRK